jgi:hypothetical protein
MKKISFCFVLLVCLKTSFSQDNEGGFNMNKMFAGGTVVLGLGFGNNSQFTIGGNPELGYTIFETVDLGVCGNYIYSSASYLNTNGNTYKTNITLSGLGIFTRLHVSEGFFIQLQPEFNNIQYKESIKDGDDSREENFKSSSFLVGVGFGSRDVGRMNFFTTILIDLQKDKYSPYRTSTGEISPVVRSGINFYFGRKGRT